MARAGYRIFDADTHIIEAAEPIEAYLSAADKARLAGLGALVGRAAGKGGVSRYRVGKRPELNRLLGSRDSVPPADAIARGLKDGGTPWDVRWQGPPFPRRSRQLRLARPREGHGHRGRRREHGPAVGRAGGLQRAGRRRGRDDDVPGVSPLPQGLLRARIRTGSRACSTSRSATLPDRSPRSAAAARRRGRSASSRCARPG